MKMMRAAKPSFNRRALAASAMQAAIATRAAAPTTARTNLGHHVFGHGSSIDELREDAKDHPWEDPKEFLADTFAGFVRMPIMGLRRAFNVRGWAPETATATQMFTIACDFGVGSAVDSQQGHHGIFDGSMIAQHASRQCIKW